MTTLFFKKGQDKQLLINRPDEDDLKGLNFKFKLHKIIKNN